MVVVSPHLQSPIDSGFAHLQLQLVRNDALPLTPQQNQFSPVLPQVFAPNKELNSTALLQRIRSLYKRLSQLKCLSPNKETNALFTELVTFVVQGNHHKADFYKLMERNDVRDICEETRLICSKAESEMETYWADCLISGTSQMSDFPYQDNYADLTRLEYHLLCGQGADPQHVMFIGSGPLPLSGLTLASGHLSPRWKDDTWSVLNVDICPQANKLGSAVAKRALPNLQSQLSFLDCDATNIDPSLINKFDVIYLAALVGLDMKCKESIIRNLVVHMKPGSRLLLRSATGLRRLLYPVIDENKLLMAAEGRLELEVVCHPRNFVVNSVVIARRI